MKYLTPIGVILIALVSCLEKVDFEQDQYVKVLGLEGSAIAERIIELENGDIMVLGKLGVAAHDILSGPNGPEFLSVEDQAPFIAITDRNGNIKRIEAYPIEAYELEYAIVSNIENKATFKDIIPDPQGGYTVLVELRNFDIVLEEPIQIEILSNPNQQVTNHLLLKLDSDFKIIKMISINCESDWDFIYRPHAVIKELPNNEIGVLLGIKAFPSDNFRFGGYSFLRMNHNLEVLARGDDFNRDGIKFSHDFDVDDQNRIILIGQRNYSTVLYRFPMENMTYEAEEYEEIDYATNQINTNEHFIISHEDGGSTMLYTRSSSDVLFQRRGPNLNYKGPPVNLPNPSQLKGLIRVPRAFYQTMNGDFLVYNLHIPDSQEPIEGYLHRISNSGDPIWSIKIEGTPGDVIETNTGDILVASNTVYNGLLHRVNLIKLNANGELY